MINKAYLIFNIIFYNKNLKLQWRKIQTVLDNKKIMKEVKLHVLEMQKKCCFSVYTLKSLISIGTVVTLLIGIALLYVLVYAFVVSSVTAQIQTTFRNVFIGSFLASSMFMIFSSLAGIYGLIRKKNKLLVFYAITMVLYFASFIVLGIFLASYPNSLISQCGSSTQSDFQLAINQANKTLCKKDCECYFPQIELYTPSQRIILQNMGVQSTDNQSLPVNAENCQKWNNQTYIQTQQLIMIQSFFECAGWCNVDSRFNLYYMFTNVNKGIPTNGCIQAIIDFFDDFGLILQVSSFIVSGILFIILVHIVCLCWHPQRSNQYDALKFFKQTLVVNQSSDQDMDLRSSAENPSN